MRREHLVRFLGRRSGGSNPNTSDSASEASIRISASILEQLEIDQVAPVEGQAAGTELERQVAEFLREPLAEPVSGRDYTVHHPSPGASSFRQYQHLEMLQRLIDDDESNTLSVAIGREYNVKPDVTVGYELDAGSLPLLHASVSCKLTLRSDRAQNIRQEAAILMRQRRGRLPHIVAVTAEPLPTRIASIARGTGDVDAVYHVAFPELVLAVESFGTDEQRATLDELVGQGRLLSTEQLGVDLAY